MRRTASNLANSRVSTRKLINGISHAILKHGARFLQAAVVVYRGGVGKEPIPVPPPSSASFGGLDKSLLRRQRSPG